MFKPYDVTKLEDWKVEELKKRIESNAIYLQEAKQEQIRTKQENWDHLKLSSEMAVFQKYLFETYEQSLAAWITLLDWSTQILEQELSKRSKSSAF